MSGAKEALMVLVSGNLRVALVTTHIPVKDISSQLQKDLIARKSKPLNKVSKKISDSLDQESLYSGSIHMPVKTAKLAKKNNRPFYLLFKPPSRKEF